MFMVEPAELIGIETARRRRESRELEPMYELVAREHFVIAVRPAKPSEIVDHRLGQVTVVAILKNAARAVTFRQLVAFGREHRRQMRIYRFRHAERANQIDL